MTVRQTILLRRAKRWSLASLILLCVLDYARVLGYQGDDWRRFNRAIVHVDEVIDHRTFRAGDTTIRLLGIAENPSDGGDFLRGKIAGNPVMLTLDEPQTRDAAGRLLANAYLSPDDSLNVDCVARGGASIDPAANGSNLADLQLAESKRQKVWRRWQ